MSPIPERVSAARRARIGRLTARFHQARTDEGRNRAFALLVRAVSRGRFGDRDSLIFLARSVAQSLDPDGHYCLRLPEGWRPR